MLGLTLLVSLAALLVPGGTVSVAQRLPPFAAWVLGILLYAVFWIAMVGFIAAGTGAGDVNAMLLLLAWAGFVLILPASVAAAAEAIDPPPSRIAHLAQAREIEIRTSARRRTSPAASWSITRSW